jgi:hypothetical protein
LHRCTSILRLFQKRTWIFQTNKLFFNEWAQHAYFIDIEGKNKPTQHAYFIDIEGKNKPGYGQETKAQNLKIYN